MFISVPFLVVLVGWSAAGCGYTAASHTPLTHTHAELVQARSQVRRYAAALVTAVEHSRRSRIQAIFGTYRSCPAGKGLITYSDSITVTAEVPATLPAFSHEIAGMLRSEGWRLVSVDFAKSHLELGSTNHPLYNMRQLRMSGAANILPYQSDGAGALIFMNSPCINAGSLAARLIRGGNL